MMEQVRIEGRRGGAEFMGTLVSAVTTQTPERARWFEMKLWEHQDGGWVIDRISMSLIYHASNTNCRRRDNSSRRTPSAPRLMGSPTKVADLPDEAEPCGECNPAWPNEMQGETMVRFEVPRHTVIHCPTAVDVVEAVTTDPNRPGQPFASGPATELLLEAASKDPLIAGALRESGAVSSVKVE